MDLSAETTRFGAIAYLATAGTSGPHVVPVHLDWHRGRLVFMLGLGDRKTANLRFDPRVCIHWPVGEATGWDSLVVWGTARIRDTDVDRREWWHGVFSYDLDRFSPGGPEGSPETGFGEVTPTRAVLLRSFGEGGRDEWRAR